MNRTGDSAQPYVFIVEIAASADSTLASVVLRAGARPLATVYPIPTTIQGCARLALIRLAGAHAADQNELNAIRTLRAANIAVVAVCESCRQWSLRDRCEPLLAGAAQLLDAGANGFDAELLKVIEFQLSREQRREQEDQSVSSLARALGIVGSSKELRDALLSIIRFASLTDVPVLLQGETGTGKELLARALHRLDPKRAQQPFVAVNCAAINRHLAESELFGHTRGSFTGADKNRRGLFRAAHGGIIFLDEIGELDLEVQGKLLRVLQDSRVQSVGADHSEQVDVRVVAATNRDLRAAASQESFRPDLYYRLSALSVRVPPLRERPDDIRALVEHFFDKYAYLYQGEAVATDEFIDGLRLLRLDGNVRQLENMIRELLVLKQDGASFRLSDLPADLLHTLHDASIRTTEAVAPADPAAETLVSFFERSGWSFDHCLGTCERLLLTEVLQRTHGNQAEAARLLGVTPRTIYNKIRKHGISV